MLPSILKKDIRLTTLSDLSRESFNALRDTIQDLQVLDIEHVDASYLPWLAWWFRVDMWDESWSEEQKREVVINALVLFKYKGTIWAVKRSLSLVGYHSKLTLWYQMKPQGIPGTFIININKADDIGWNKDDYDKTISLVEINKQASQKWSLIVTTKPRLSTIYHGVAVSSRKHVLITNKG